MKSELRVLLVATSVASTAGCYSYHRAEPHRGTSEPIPATAWSVEVSDELRALGSMTPEVVYRFALDESVPEDERSRKAVDLAALIEKRVTHVEIRSDGLLRLYEDAEPPEPLDELDAFRPNGSFLTAPLLTRARVEMERDVLVRYEDRMMVGEHPGLRLAEPDVRALLLQDGGVALGTPSPAPNARGIVLHLPAMFSTPYERRVLEQLARHGWAIAHVDTESWIAGPNHLERERVRAARQERSAELREVMLGPDPYDAAALERINEVWDAANRQAEAEIPIPETGFEVREGDDPDRAAQRIARAVDQHLVAHANAAAALVGYLDDHRPDVSGKPLVVVGFSAGALAAPTVAARLGDRVSAVVLIGGGASLFDVSRRSTLGDGGIDIVPPSGPAPPEHLVDQVGERYRAHTQVDPYRAARALRSTPVLHVYGSRDEIIPTATAETLQSQLGEPDHLVFSGGHSGLFYFLPGKGGFIAKWMDDRCRSADASPSGAEMRQQTMMQGRTDA